MGKMIDITGQQFGYLTALHPTTVQGRFGWHCRCICGNEIDVNSGNLRKGRTKSCGCKKSELISNRLMKDLTGQRFGYLIAIKPLDERNKGEVVWECQCDCGKIIKLPTNKLTSGHTKSCGCKTIELIGQAKRDNLVGQKFNKLTVIQLLGLKDNTAVWQCKCDCGNITSAFGWQLTSNRKCSCGCLKSKGEMKISSILSANNIKYETQKRFDTCATEDNNYLFYDFFLPDKNILLEYDGEQHFKYSGRGWSTKENYEKTKKYDMIKNIWSINNHIPLYRIPYTDFDKITTYEDIIKKEYLVQEGTL